MRIKDKSVLLTGAGRGIGAALALRFARERPRGIAICDIDGEAARQTAAFVRLAGVPAIAVETDVAGAEQVAAAVARARDAYDSVEVVCSNAGVDVMGHVHVAQAVLPSMAHAGSGCLVLTASAPRRLAVPDDVSCTVAKVATVGLAAWLATSFGHYGITVSVLCPPPDGSDYSAATAIADAVVRGIAAERFLILERR